MDEKVLLEKARSGDREALEILLYDNYKILYGYLLKLTMDEEITKDITQEAMVKAIINIRKFKGDSRFSTWLISIASNLYRDSIRKRRRISAADIVSLPDRHNESIEEGVMNREMLNRIGKMLLELPEEKRRAFILKNYYSYTYEEIAKILKCPVGTVRSRLHYCIRKLRELI